MLTRIHIAMKLLLPFLVLSAYTSIAQENELYQRLPMGKHAVGFEIFTIYDSSRVVKPLHNYFGEKESGNRYQKITVHLWYPAQRGTGKDRLTYGDYCYNHLLSRSNETLDEQTRLSMVNNYRNYFQGFFGPVADSTWELIRNSPMLAQRGAKALKEVFPLLVGMLRPLSTSITNELMASNGYIVAMVKSTAGKLPLGYATDVADMQRVIAHLRRSRRIDEEQVGTYGFSGSGFSQVLLAMNDPRVKALADIESALYGERIGDIFYASDYYNPVNLRIPFLHIYGRELATGDTEFEQFHKKKYSHRYHLTLNYTGLHHWDVATEGRASSTIVNVRGDKQAGVRASFELANIALLNFFDAVLKRSKNADANLNTRKAFSTYHDSLWTFSQYAALSAPPDRSEFEAFINRKGIDSAVVLARSFFSADSSVEFLTANNLNALARQLYGSNKQADGIKLSQLAVQFHPKEAWLWNNLADMHDNSGNKEDAIKYSEKVLELLKDVSDTGQSFDERIKRSAKRRVERLKAR
jgi:dienelactone hydrolase